MKPKLFVFALLISLTLFGSFAFADLVLEAQKSSGALEVTDVVYNDSVENASFDRSDSSVSVPEPATFGLISIALAVGGGLMIRRKAD